MVGALYAEVVLKYRNPVIFKKHVSGASSLQTLPLLSLLRLFSKTATQLGTSSVSNRLRGTRRKTDCISAKTASVGR